MAAQLADAWAVQLAELTAAAMVEKLAVRTAEN
jgi:hypothetical protein